MNYVHHEDKSINLLSTFPDSPSSTFNEMLNNKRAKGISANKRDDITLELVEEDNVLVNEGDLEPNEKPIYKIFVNVEWMLY